MGDNEAGAASPKSPERQIYAAYVPPPSGGSGEGLSEPTASFATSRRASALLNADVDIDLPDRNFFRLATSEQLKRHAARSRAVSFRRRGVASMVTHTGGTTPARSSTPSCAPRVGARAGTCTSTAL